MKETGTKHLHDGPTQQMIEEVDVDDYAIDESHSIIMEHVPEPQALDYAMSSSSPINVTHSSSNIHATHISSSSSSLRASATHNRLAAEQNKLAAEQIKLSQHPAPSSRYSTTQSSPNSLRGIGTQSNTSFPSQQNFPTEMEEPLQVAVLVAAHEQDDQVAQRRQDRFQQPDTSSSTFSQSNNNNSTAANQLQRQDTIPPPEEVELLDADVTVVVQNQPRVPKVAMVAHEPRLTDFLENRNLQLTLGGILCLVIVAAIVAAVSVVLASSDDSASTSTASEASATVTSIAPTISLIPTLAPSILVASSSPSLVTTAVPTIAPTYTPLLVDLPDYTRKALQNPSSPQARAYQWLEQHPNLASLQDWEMQQYIAIISIYYGTNGPQSWPADQEYTQHVLSYNSSICQWLPSVASTSGDTLLGPCRNATDTQRITHLTLQDLEGNFMMDRWQGTIPPEISLLTDLEEFRVVESDLVRHKLEAFWPVELSSLPKLRKIEFWANNLYGTLPPVVLMAPELAQQLTFLSLASNTVLAGSLPTELGLLTSLQLLYLEVNSFTSSIPSELGNLKQLQALRLYQNELTGTIPLEITSELSNIQTLWLERNHLTGTLPQDLCVVHPLLAARSRVRLDCDEVPCPENCSCGCGG